MTDQNINNSLFTERIWDDSDYGDENYTGMPVDEKMIRDAETKLGYRLPASYVELLKTRNGGILDKCVYTTEDGTDFYAEGIYGIDPEKKYSLMNPQFDTAFWVEEWGYPANLGLVIADTPSGGHDLFFLDYRECGPDGEPAVVHVDNELGNIITTVAPDFRTFLYGLHEDDTPVYIPQPVPEPQPASHIPLPLLIIAAILAALFLVLRF